MKIEIGMTHDMLNAQQSAYENGESLSECMVRALGAMTPEAKRELAAQLLRSASVAEGYAEV